MLFLQRYPYGDAYVRIYARDVQITAQDTYRQECNPIFFYPRKLMYWDFIVYSGKVFRKVHTGHIKGKKNNIYHCWKYIVIFINFNIKHFHSRSDQCDFFSPPIHLDKHGDNKKSFCTIYGLLHKIPVTALSNSDNFGQALSLLQYQLPPANAVVEALSTIRAKWLAQHLHHAQWPLKQARQEGPTSLRKEGMGSSLPAVDPWAPH